jgi:Grx4 family monothiol glutaredoxin
MAAVFSALPSLAGSSPTPIAFTSVEAETSDDLTAQYNVELVPTFVLTRADGSVFTKIESPDPAALSAAVLGLVEETKNGTTGDNSTAAAASASSSSSSSSTPADTAAAAAPVDDGSVLTDSLKAAITTLLSSAPILLFMKGTPQAPKCGFSRQIVELLQAGGIEFSSFDILNKDQQHIRNGLKLYNDWPTYPQLHVNGELVGGLDIVKEMAAEGDLAEQLGVTKEPTIDERLKALTSRSKVMLFMKGLPSAPKCGFSRQIVEILNEHCKIGFDAFNILEDETVRQELKRYSDWPSYPQLYVDGELVGGLDICREMIEAGELQEMLQ